jgi:hypothetical protein
MWPKAKKFLKTSGLVLLVAFGINLLFAGALALVDYDRLLGQNLWRGILFTIAYVIVRLWQQRDQTVPLFGEPRWRWQWLEGKPDRKLAMLFLVALIAVSGLAAYLALHQQQRTPSWDSLSLTPPRGITPDASWGTPKPWHP